MKKTMGKPLALVMAIFALIMCFPTVAMAHNTDTETYICALPAPTNMQRAASAAPAYVRSEPRGLLASISVNISSPCDEEFRALFPNDWMYQANARVEEGDNPIYDWFGIDYYSVRQESWSSPNYMTDGYELYYDAKDTWGKTGTADLMIAFSAQTSPFGGLGASDGYSVCWEFGFRYTSDVVSHESGHMYGVSRDGGCSTNCLMSGFPSEICSYCFGVWDNNKYNW